MTSLYLSVYNTSAAISALSHSQYFTGLIVRQSLLASNEELDMLFSDLIPLAQKQNIQLYFKDNRLLHNAHLDTVKQNIKHLKGHSIGLFIGDPAVIALAQEIAYDGDIIFAPEMILTSHQNAQFWLEQGAHNVEISHELTFKEINAIMNNLSITPFVQVHGQLSMFQSRRLLIDNYYTHLNYHAESDETTHISLYDKERDLNYTIIQDDRGTEIYNGQSISIIDLLDRFDSFPRCIIDTYFLTTNKQVAVIQLYSEALQDSNYVLNKEMYAQKMKMIYGDEPLSRGFFLKPTIF